LHLLVGRKVVVHIIKVIVVNHTSNIMCGS
jgi:hypothetical protein